MKKNEIITINARKFNQKIHRTWKCDFVEETDDYYVFLGKFESQVEHKELGVIKAQTVSYEYYWKREFYNVFRFYEPDGEFRNFYCNINLPPTFANNILEYIDLDVDILVWKDFRVEVLDLEEYQTNIKEFNYTTELQQKVSQTIEKLLEKIETRSFPFEITV